jgi:WD40 repeat protein
VTIDIAFSPDGKILATTAADGAIQFWNPATGQAIGGPFGPTADQSSTSIAFNPNGSLLAEIPGKGPIRIWNVATLTHAYATLCDDVGSPTSATWATYATGQKEPAICPTAERGNI